MNALNHSDCSLNALAVFHNIFLISESKFLSPSIKAVVGTCACAIFLDDLDFRLFMLDSQSRNQDEFTVSFILKRKFFMLYFEEAVRILSECEFS